MPANGRRDLIRRLKVNVELLHWVMVEQVDLYSLPLIYPVAAHIEWII
jgi:hypothetical protein